MAPFHELTAEKGQLSSFFMALVHLEWSLVFVHMCFVSAYISDISDISDSQHPAIRKWITLILSARETFIAYVFLFPVLCLLGRSPNLSLDKTQRNSWVFVLLVFCFVTPPPAAFLLAEFPCRESYQAGPVICFPILCLLFAIYQAHHIAI